MDMGIGSYENFNEDTKIYLNKAMDIYNAIKDKEITKEVQSLFELKDYKFTKTDKKVLSLYLAAFLVDGKLKNILCDFDEIDVAKLYDYLGINDLCITNSKNIDYKQYYEDNFESEILLMIQNQSSYYEISSIKPELIVSFLANPSACGSDAIEYFFRENNIKHSIFGGHPSFNVIKAYALKTGCMKEKTSSNKFNRNRGGLFSLNVSPFERVAIKEEPQQESKKGSPKIDLSDEKIWDILDEVQKKFIGQEVAAEQLFYNIINNQSIASNEEMRDGERSIIFLDGPTGTGKTAITREITSKLDIPFTSTSATNYSSTGYVGGNITDTLKELYIQADGDLEKAQRGIIVFDEFDKLSYSGSGGLEMKKAVQQQLLDFMGGGKYTINVGNHIFDNSTVEFDTSKLTFICLGALSNLRTAKTETKHSLGFVDFGKESDITEYTITPQDLIGIGLERELVGRFNTYIHTEEYSKEDLFKILKESDISPMIGFKKWIEANGKKLEIEDGVYNAIVDAAYELNTGARSLQTVMNNIRTHYMRAVLRGNEETIYLDLDTVLNINASMVVRKGRK